MCEDPSEWSLSKVALGQESIWLARCNERTQAAGIQFRAPPLQLSSEE